VNDRIEHTQRVRFGRERAGVCDAGKIRHQNCFGGRYLSERVARTLRIARVQYDTVTGSGELLGRHLAQAVGRAGDEDTPRRVDDVVLLLVPDHVVDDSMQHIAKLDPHRFSVRFHVPANDLDQVPPNRLAPMPRAGRTNACISEGRRINFLISVPLELTRGALLRAGLRVRSRLRPESFLVNPPQLEISSSIEPSVGGI
jgi:hypothetical protein